MKQPLKRIVLHWTAGAGSPSAFDRQFYHYLIDAKGNVIKGVFSPEANLDCTDGVYAAHTGDANTGSIGIALCAMANFDYATRKTAFPITKIQLEKLFSFTAKLCKKYGIKVNKDTVFTHYEFGMLHPESTSKGKIDIIYLQPYPNVHKYQIGNFIRAKVNWYIENGSSALI